MLIESGTFGVNVVESVLSGKNYVRSLKGLQLLKEAMSRLQWVEFFKKDSNVAKHREVLEKIILMRSKVSEKSKEGSIKHLQDFKEVSCDKN